ncbi:hypothetical protein GCG21_15640 [Pseudactinotalea sp. HY160]|uniref:hypothetical protein n=1 Tax=Pseudactinotalea sp. HY160 TaxID=2654490 RepID=UPI00128B8912|nr:hypothetical protein [Pseudactinotalea sp. HY160]MPV51417.1 hypothetical protein [Pseudactinotalea sp. HY160]
MSEPGPYGGVLPAVPVDWRGLSGDEAWRTWHDLAEWTSWLVVRFNIAATTIPPCWPRHTRLVEELTALWSAHQLWYDDASPATGPLTWLRELEWAQTRLRAAVSDAGCTAREHLAPRTEPWPADAAAADVLAEVAGADARAREQAQITAALTTAPPPAGDESPPA